MVAVNVGRDIEGVCSIVDAVEATRMFCGPQQRGNSCLDGGKVFLKRWHDCNDPQQDKAVLTQMAALEI